MHTIHMSPLLAVTVVHTQYSHSHASESTNYSCRLSLFATKNQIVQLCIQTLTHPSARIVQSFVCSTFQSLSLSFPLVFLINVMQTTRGQKTIIKIEFRLRNLSVPHIRSSLHFINTLCLHSLFIAAKNHMWLKNEDQQYCDVDNEEQQRKNERKK